MQFFYEFFPVLLFFIAFKVYDIYIATIVGILVTLLQVIVTRLWNKNWDKKQLITLGVFLVFGGMTLYFHNPIFIKWKPTVIFWIFSMLIVGSHFFTKKTLIQHLMENVLQEKNTIPFATWKRLNLAWGLFFFILGSVNLYIAYQFSNSAWVNFKFYGISAALLLFSILQALCLTRYITEQK